MATRESNLRKLTDLHEKVRQQSLGQPVAIQRDMAFVLHNIENKMRQLRGIPEKPWLPVFSDDDDDE